MSVALAVLEIAFSLRAHTHTQRETHNPMKTVSPPIRFVHLAGIIITSTIFS